MYEMVDFSTLSIAEMEEMEKEARDYFSKLDERYPKASGHPFTSDPEQLRKAQEERELYSKFSYEINSEIWKRKKELCISNLELDLCVLKKELSDIEESLHKLLPTFKNYLIFKKENKKMKKISMEISKIEYEISKRKIQKP